MKPTPTVHALVIADSVFPQMDGKWCIIGTFQEIYAAQFPCTHYQIGVYLVLSEAEGKYDLELQLIDADETTVASIKGTFTAANRLMRAEIGLNIRGIVFPRPGEFGFRILIDGHEIHYPIRLWIRQLEKPKT